MRINIKAFALACALIWGVGLFLMTWWMIAFDGPVEAAEFLAVFYRGYSLSAMGSVIGFVWAFADGILGGAVFAWLYNTLAERMGGQKGVGSSE